MKNNIIERITLSAVILLFCSSALLAENWNFTRGKELYDKKEYGQALPYLQEAAKSDASIEAMYLLGIMYQYGYGTDINKVIALNMYTKAAEKDHVLAMARLGLFYETSTPPDYSKAATWYRRAAEKDQGWAQGQLGILYLSGKGVDENETTAFQWLLKAAENSNSFVYSKVGYMLYVGQGCSRDFAAAYKWFDKVAENEDDYPYALRMKGIMLHGGTALPKNEEQAVEFFKKAAGKEDIWATYYLGEMYEYGYGVNSISMVRALAYYQKAAQTNNPAAQCALGRLYAEGKGVEKSDERALEWTTKAVNQKYVEAYYYRAKLYEKGIGGSPNYESAKSFYLKAADENNTDAQLALGDLYFQGLGVEKDMKTAVNWYSTAMNAGSGTAIEKLRQLGKEGIAEAHQAIVDIENKTQLSASVTGLNFSINDSQKTFSLSSNTILGMGNDDYTVKSSDPWLIVAPSGTHSFSVSVKKGILETGTHDAIVTVQAKYGKNVIIPILVESDGKIIVKRGLKAYYTFDDGTANDQSESHLHANLIGKPNFISDTPKGEGKAIFLNSMKGQSINIPGNPVNERVTESFSFSFWIKDFDSGLIYSGISHNFRARVNYPRLISRYGLFYVASGGISIAPREAPSFGFRTSDIQDSKWHHLVVTNEGGAGATPWKKILYVDGILVSNMSTSIDYYTNENCTEIHFGGNGAGMKDLDGSDVLSASMKLDNIRIYNRVLSQEEVKTIYESENK